MTAPQLASAVTLSFFKPSPALQPFITSIYLTKIDLPAGERVTDWMLPEWPNLRMAPKGDGLAAIGSEALRSTRRIMAAGPSSYATRIEIGSADVWGVGMLPLGWSRFVGLPAAAYADRFSDGESDPAWAALAPLFEITSASDVSAQEKAEQCDALLCEQLGKRPPAENEAIIRLAHRTLIDEELATVSDLAERLAMSPRTLERFCLRVFGFPPKLLLRRQRFSRSLGQFLLNPRLSWTDTLDERYFDQPHFVRDFKRFMGMSPSGYAAQDHPILRAAAHARNLAVGGAVQALHQP
jgi:AraC-like DNA-binding protein